MHKTFSFVWILLLLMLLSKFQLIYKYNIFHTEPFSEIAFVLYKNNLSEEEVTKSILRDSEFYAYTDFMRLLHLFMSLEYINRPAKHVPKHIK